MHRRNDAIRRRTPILSHPHLHPLHMHTIYDVHIVVVGATKKCSTFASPYSTLCYINPILTHNIALTSRIGSRLYRLDINNSASEYRKLLLIHRVTLFRSSLIRRMINRHFIPFLTRIYINKEEEKKIYKIHIINNKNFSDINSIPSYYKKYGYKN